MGGIPPQRSSHSSSHSIVRSQSSSSCWEASRKREKMKRPTAPILALVVLLLVFSSVEGRVEVNSGIAVPHATDQRIPMKPLSLSLSLRRDVSSLQLSATPSARRGAPRRAPRIDASSTAACAAGTAAACPPAPTATRTSAPATGTRSPPIRRRSPSAHEHPPPPPHRSSSLAPVLLILPPGPSAFPTKKVRSTPTSVSM